MTRKERYKFVIDYFQQHAPGAETELQYDNPYELLVAVILSAQCTDKRVNMTTPVIDRYGEKGDGRIWRQNPHDGGSINEAAGGGKKNG